MRKEKCEEKLQKFNKKMNNQSQNLNKFEDIDLKVMNEGHL